MTRPKKSTAQNVTPKKVASKGKSLTSQKKSYMVDDEEDEDDDEETKKSRLLDDDDDDDDDLDTDLDDSKIVIKNFDPFEEDEDDDDF